MSTKANIKVIGDHGTVFLYRHSDGYPDGLGEELQYFIQDKGYFTQDAKEFAEELINVDSQLRFVDREHGNIEYLYVIDLTEKSFECLHIIYDYIKRSESVFKHSNLKVLFADLDGTLIKTYSGDAFPRGVWDMKFRFDVWDKIKELKFDYIFIVSNQGGIEKGFVDSDKFTSKMEYVVDSLIEYTGNFNIFYDFCASNDKSDYYRKPNPGMLEELVESMCALGPNFPKENMFMIGDASGKEGQFSDSDKKCAENFGIAYMDVEDFLHSFWVREQCIIQDEVASKNPQLDLENCDNGDYFEVGDTVQNRQTGFTAKIVKVTDRNYMFVDDIFIFDNEDGFSKDKANNWRKI